MDTKKMKWVTIVKTSVPYKIQTMPPIIVCIEMVNFVIFDLQAERNRNSNRT